ncbi:MAG: hypothetical protein AAF518_25750 [Spirochaetota bacterium]
MDQQESNVTKSQPEKPKVDPLAEVVQKLRVDRETKMKFKAKGREIEEKIYIPLRVSKKPILPKKPEEDEKEYEEKTSKKSKPLDKSIESFLFESGFAYLLLAPSGAGKTAYGRLMESKYLASWKDKRDWIPIFLSLSDDEILKGSKKIKLIHDEEEFEEDDVKESESAHPMYIKLALQKKGLDEPDIELLKTKASVLFFLDGHDEIDDRYRGSGLRKRLGLETWNKAKIIVTSRAEVLDSAAANTLFMGGRGYFINYLIPLTPSEQEECLKKLIKSSFNENEIDFKDCQNILENKHGYLLHMMYQPQVLRMIFDLIHDDDIGEWKEAGVLEKLISKWFEDGYRRRGRLDLKPHEFKNKYNNYMQRLSFKMFSEGKTRFITRDESDNPIERYQEFSLDSKEEKELGFRKYSSIIQRVDNRGRTEYGFYHNIIRDYFVVQKIKSSVLKGIFKDIYENTLIKDEGILRLFAQYAQDSKELTKVLWKVAQDTGVNGTGRRNAVAILAKAGVSFRKRNLQELNLENLALDSAKDLEQADFDGANLQNVSSFPQSFENHFINEAKNYKKIADYQRSQNMYKEAIDSYEKSISSYQKIPHMYIAKEEIVKSKNIIEEIEERWQEEREGDLRQADRYKLTADQNRKDWKYTTAVSNYREALNLYYKWLPRSSQKIEDSQTWLRYSNKHKNGVWDQG